MPENINKHKRSSDVKSREEMPNVGILCHQIGGMTDFLYQGKCRDFYLIQLLPFFFVKTVKSSLKKKIKYFLMFVYLKCS